ncbi:MAG: glycosyltransferase, partial [Campylobacterota bacterium]|nr:glycosyltransferase [Campylobacterota bacterium]
QFKRRDSTNFIGSYTQQREEILIKLESADLELYGLKWNKLHRRPQNWRISTNMVDYKKLIDIYNSTVSSINISQIQNVSNGVNMRIFETVACGSCLITDNLKDLELCFEPNKEVLVYNDTDELLELIQKVNNDKKFASSIVHNAQQRIQNSKYTYKDRTQYMIENTQR